MKIKNAVALAMLLGGGIALNAQESTMPAPVSLSGLVSEVEDFMDVNAFQDVTFEKVFVYAGWSDTTNSSSSSTSSNTFNMGVAKNFGSLYTGLFFNADFTGFKNTITTETTTNSKKTTATGEATDGNGFAISALVGFGNIGIKGSVLFKNGGSGNNTGTTTTVSDNSTTSTETEWTQKYELYPEIRAGMNLEVGDIALSPYAYFGLDINPNYSSTKTTSSSYGTTFTKDDSSHTWILFGLGSGLALPEGEMAAHSFAAALDFAFDTDERNTYSTNSSANTSTKTTGYGNSIVTFTPEWSVDITPIETVTVSFGASLPFKFINETTAHTTTSVSGTTTTTEKADTYKNSVTTDIEPSFNADVVWQAAEKLGVHVGAEFTLPTFEIENSTDYTANLKTNTHTFEFKPASSGSSDFNIAWTTGLRFDLTKNVIFDASWNIIGDLFNNFTNDPTNSGTTTTTTTNFWEIVGKTFFHEVSFLIVIKL